MKKANGNSLLIPLTQQLIDGTEVEVDFPSFDFRCPISLLYEDVVFPENNTEDSADR